MYLLAVRWVIIIDFPRRKKFRRNKSHKGDFKCSFNFSWIQKPGKDKVNLDDKKANN